MILKAWTIEFQSWPDMKNNGTIKIENTKDLQAISLGTLWPSIVYGTHTSSSYLDQGAKPSTTCFLTKIISLVTYNFSGVYSPLLDIEQKTR